jgi:hypothetical protein
VVHIDAVPALRIPAASVDAARQLNAAWELHARQGSALASDSSFLVAGGLDDGWVHVRLTEATDISALEDRNGEMLFIARSISGHRVCAASKEAGEYWILEADFSND